MRRSAGLSLNRPNEPRLYEVLPQMIRILIADDHQMFREGIQSLLETSCEFQVIAMAETGFRAVELARQHAPDLVIMDVSMPDLNGIDATRIILDALPDTKVIALSMYSEKNFVLEMLKAGAAGYLLKDEAFDMLLDAIETTRHGGTCLPPRISSILMQELRTGGEPPLLSPRQIEVLRLLASGKSAQRVADELCLSIKTVETHRSNIMKKLDLQNLADMTRYAVRNRLVDP